MIFKMQIMSRLFKIEIMLCCCFLFTNNYLNAQSEAIYSQYMYNMINVNPAYAGNRVGDNITSIYRKQWVNIAGAPTSYSISWDRGTKDIGDGLVGRDGGLPIGYGLQIYSDKLGIEATQGIQGFYSYRIKFNNSFLTMGLSGGVMNYRAAYSQVITPDPDPVFQEDVNGIVPTVGLGFLYSTMSWYVGLSTPSLLRTKISNNSKIITTGTNSRYFLTGGYIFNISEDLKLKPSVMLKAIKGESFQYDINLNAWIQNTVGLGVSYRAKDAVVGMIQLRVTPKITLGYAYDYLISNLKTFSKGSHELILNVEFNKPKDYHVISPRYY